MPLLAIAIVAHEKTRADINGGLKETMDYLACFGHEDDS